MSVQQKKEILLIFTALWFWFFFLGSKSAELRNQEMPAESLRGGDRKKHGTVLLYLWINKNMAPQMKLILLQTHSSKLPEKVLFCIF